MRLDEATKSHILITFSKYNYNRTHTAKALGIGLRTLQRKLTKYGVAPGKAGGSP